MSPRRIGADLVLILLAGVTLAAGCTASPAPTATTVTPVPDLAELKRRSDVIRRAEGQFWRGVDWLGQGDETFQRAASQLSSLRLAREVRFAFLEEATPDGPLLIPSVRIGREARLFLAVGERFVEPEAIPEEVVAVYLLGSVFLLRYYLISASAQDDPAEFRRQWRLRPELQMRGRAIAWAAVMEALLTSGREDLAREDPLRGVLQLHKSCRQAPDPLSCWTPQLQHLEG